MPISVPVKPVRMNALQNNAASEAILTFGPVHPQQRDPGSGCSSSTTAMGVLRVSSRRRGHHSDESSSVTGPAGSLGLPRAGADQRRDHPSSEIVD